jgi:3-oxosteroid 1-dehydrogenase
MSDQPFNFVIVGSGAGGLAAAITAKLAGLHPLVLEKTPLIGGSSVMSGGVLWLPNNSLMNREGVSDSREDALRYMENFVDKDPAYSTSARREAFIDNIAPFLMAMEAQGMLYRRCPEYPDYYDTLPGGNAAGRSVQAELFDVNRLGAWKPRLRQPYVALPIRTSEGAKLQSFGVSLAGKIMFARVGGRMAWAKARGRTIFGSGGALQGRMLEIALKLGVEIWTDARLIDLDVRNRGVEGVHINYAGREMTIPAARGALIAAGGFSRNCAMRQHYQRHPISDKWTHANPGDTGEAIEAMIRVGAGLGVMEEAWWIPTWIGPNGQLAQIVPELAKPHGMLVDHSGKRFVNEANSYMEIGRAMYTRHALTPAIPAWLVMDARSRKRYMFGFQFQGRMPRTWIKEGLVQQDDTLAGLAMKCGIDPAGLERTVAQFNASCERGTDEVYGRGSSAYNRYYADPTKHNPCLGQISEGPFWAAPLYPGDVGTCGGAIVNEYAQVLRSDGTVIGGLYATGNSSASLCGPHYIGAGQSIGASSVFGYVAARTAAQ